MNVRTYTVEEANLILPKVRTLVERIVSTTSEIPDLEEEARIRKLKSVRPGAGESATEDLAQSVAALRAAEMALMVAQRSLEEMNVTVKDRQAGLVDFLSYRDGRV